MTSSKTLTLTSKLQPPPGPTTLPTTSNPRASTNPAIFNDSLSVRLPIFVDEQGIAAEAEMDDDDARSWSWVIYTPPQKPGGVPNGVETGEGGESVPIGVIRLVPPPHPPHETLVNPNPNRPDGGEGGWDLTHEPYIKLTRVAVLPTYRGLGVSRRLVEMALEWARGHAGEIDAAYARVAGTRKEWSGLVMVHAQSEVEGVYTRQGFTTDKRLGRWKEEGIEHVGMVRRIDVIHRKTIDQ